MNLLQFTITNYGPQCSYRLSPQRLNDLVYVYYIIRLWGKQLDKEPDTDAISLDAIDTTSQWRVEIEEPEMEETPEWLDEDEHADDLGEEATAEEEWGEEEQGEEEEEEDVPLPEDTEVEEEIHLPVQRAPPPPPRKLRATAGQGLRSVGTGRRQSTLLLGSSSSAGAAGASTPSSS